MLQRVATLSVVLAVGLLSMGVSKCGKVIYVVAGDSIQEAVDSAAPGDTIIVAAGYYTGSGVADAVVEVGIDGLTLIGKPDAVIDATGYDYAVKVGDRSSGCLTGDIEGFSIDGFTFQNAENSGVFLANVNDYSMTGGTYLDNAEYGPYPVCSTNGVVAENYASGHNDAAIYVGQSDGALIEKNETIDSVIGIEVENTTNAVVRNNTATGNTAGIFVVILPGLNVTVSEDILIEDNFVSDNNRPNTAGGGNLALLPEGTGILNLGGDRVVMRKNIVTHNDTYGIAIAGNPFFVLDPAIEPFPDDNVTLDNFLKRNGENPDTQRGLAPPGDLVYSPDVVFPVTIPLPGVADPDPSNNCFADNFYFTEVVVAENAPGATIADFPCP